MFVEQLKSSSCLFKKQKIYGQLGFLPNLVFYHNSPINTMRKPFSKNKIEI